MRQYIHISHNLYLNDYYPIFLDCSKQYNLSEDLLDMKHSNRETLKYVSINLSCYKYFTKDMKLI